MPKVPPTATSPPPLVVGFSARALAEATRAHATHPLVVDRFADRDCQQAAHHCIELDQWGGRLDSDWQVLSQLKAAGAQPSSPVLLGGGTENWPELVELLHQHFTVLGPTARQLQPLRSPEYWQACARAAGVAFPETHWKGASAVDDRLIKAVAMRESAEGPAGHIKDWLIIGAVGFAWLNKEKLKEALNPGNARLHKKGGGAIARKLSFGIGQLLACFVQAFVGHRQAGIRQVF